MGTVTFGVNHLSGRVSSYSSLDFIFTTKCIHFVGGEFGCWVFNNSIADHPKIDNQTVCSVTSQGGLWLKNLSCQN